METQHRGPKCCISQGYYGTGTFSALALVRMSSNGTLTTDVEPVSPAKLIYLKTKERTCLEV